MSYPNISNKPTTDWACSVAGVLGLGCLMVGAPAGLLLSAVEAYAKPGVSQEGLGYTLCFLGLNATGVVLTLLSRIRAERRASRRGWAPVRWVALVGAAVFTAPLLSPLVASGDGTTGGAGGHSHSSVLLEGIPEFALRMLVAMWPMVALWRVALMAPPSVARPKPPSL
jgi:hypothetical protein